MTTQPLLHRKLAIITGASRLNGIGHAIALTFATNGADLVIQYNKSEAAAHACVKKLQDAGARAIAVQGDATSISFGETIVEATLREFPNRNIDIVVNNAGSAIACDTFSKESLEQFDSMFHANVRGPLSLVQAALPHMTSGGRIINIGSVAARISPVGANVYSASKAALNSMTFGWSRELATEGITVNTIAPGPIDTDYALPEDHPTAKAFLFNGHVKRNGTVNEVASLVLYIAGPESSYVTGQVLAVDGGVSYS